MKSQKKISEKQGQTGLLPQPNVKNEICQSEKWFKVLGMEDGKDDHAINRNTVKSSGRADKRQETMIQFYTNT